MINFNWLRMNEFASYMNNLTCKILGHKKYYDWNPYYGKYLSCQRCCYYEKKRLGLK